MHMDCERETYARSLGSTASAALGSEEIDGRRGFLLGLVGLPWLGAPVAATVAITSLSEIGQACERACRHRDWMNRQSETGQNRDWDDDRLDAEMDVVDAVFARAAREPSRSLADLSAKARLALPEVLEGLSSTHEHPEELLFIVVLRELANLVPATARGVQTALPPAGGSRPAQRL